MASNTAACIYRGLCYQLKKSTMPKIYSDETLSLVWDMITKEKLRLKEAAKELDTTPDVLNKIYQAAYRRFGCNQHSNRALGKEKVKSITKMAPAPTYVRPPAKYSNTNWFTAP